MGISGTTNSACHYALHYAGGGGGGEVAAKAGVSFIREQERREF